MTMKRYNLSHFQSPSGCFVRDGVCQGFHGLPWQILQSRLPLVNVYNFVDSSSFPVCRPSQNRIAPYAIPVTDNPITIGNIHSSMLFSQPAGAHTLTLPGGTGPAVEHLCSGRPLFLSRIRRRPVLALFRNGESEPWVTLAYGAAEPSSLPPGGGTRGLSALSPSTGRGKFAGSLLYGVRRSCSQANQYQVPTRKQFKSGDRIVSPRTNSSLENSGLLPRCYGRKTRPPTLPRSAMPTSVPVSDGYAENAIRRSRSSSRASWRCSDHSQNARQTEILGGFGGDCSGIKCGANHPLGCASSIGGSVGPASLPDTFSPLPSAQAPARPTVLCDPMNDHRSPGYWSAEQATPVGCGNGAEGNSPRGSSNEH